MPSQLIDAITKPGGIEQVTGRPAWRVRENGRERWAFVEDRNGGVWITGYPQYPVTPNSPTTNPLATGVAGASAGALIGAAVGGPAGAVAGAIVGLLFGAGVAPSKS